MPCRQPWDFSSRKGSMSVFILRRLLTLLATLAGASLIIFLVLDALPGNAAEMLMGADSSPEAIRAMTIKLGLDQPVVVRYLHWVGGLLVGDLGNSYSYGTPVAELIAERLALTIPLAVMAMLLTVVLALAAGVYTAANHNKVGDVGVMAVTQFGIAIPNFWFAILLILLFSVKLQWFSAGGFDGWGEGVLGGLKSLLLPALSLAVVQAAILARITRSAVLEVMREDFVRTRRAKGGRHPRAAAAGGRVPVLPLDALVALRDGHGEQDAGAIGQPLAGHRRLRARRGFAAAGRRAGVDPGRRDRGRHRAGGRHRARPAG